MTDKGQGNMSERYPPMNMAASRYPTNMGMNRTINDRMVSLFKFLNCKIKPQTQKYLLI